MTNLIQRIEAAKEPRRELFEEARQLIGTRLYDQYDWRLFLQGRKWEATLDAQAWTSAAEMLLDRSRYRVVAITDHLEGEGGFCKLFDKQTGRALSAVSAAHRDNVKLAAILRAERKDDHG